METQEIRSPVVLKDGMIMEVVTFRGIITGHLSVVQYQEEITDSSGWNAGPRHNLSRRKGSWTDAAKTAEEVMAGMGEEDFREKLEARREEQFPVSLNIDRFFEQGFTGCP